MKKPHEAYLKHFLINSKARQHLKSSESGKALLNIFESPFEQLQPVFQPIVSLRSHTVFGFEGLIRGAQDTMLEFPDQLFDLANKRGIVAELDHLARASVLNKYSSQPLKHYLFLNTIPEVLSRPKHLREFLRTIDTFGVAPENIVIEITEQTQIKSTKEFIQGVEKYREHGFLLALDDLGTGYNGLKLWSQLKPEFVKVDKHFILNISKDAEKYHFLETIHGLANNLNSQIIAEGVENEEDLKVLEKYGIPFVQGYLFSPPRPEVSDQLLYQWTSSGPALLNKEGKVSYLSRPIKAISSSMKVNQVTDLFLEADNINYFPVVDEGIVHGIVWRRDLMNLLASRFGRELYAKKPIKTIMDNNPIVVDHSVPVEDLSRIITDSSYLLHSEAFIITQNNKYLGCGGLYDLLRYITDLKIQNALYSNPLSGLPGNVPIQKKMQQWLDDKHHFCMFYFDLDNFKAFNDLYSFEQGDGILKAFSTLLQRHVTHADDFLGHIGGDDFVLLTRQVEGFTSLASNIINDFQEMILTFYNKRDIQQGGIQGVDREGNQKLYDIMSVSIGIMEVIPGDIDHQQHLSSIATQAKKQAKKIPGSCYHIINTTEAKSLYTKLSSQQSLPLDYSVSC
jgi:diguanylate cyclase (GGDEF)-like protein